jgi:hypothetical protein
MMIPNGSFIRKTVRHRTILSANGFADRGILEHIAREIVEPVLRATGGLAVQRMTHPTKQGSIPGQGTKPACQHQRQTSDV